MFKKLQSKTLRKEYAMNLNVKNFAILLSALVVGTFFFMTVLGLKVDQNYSDFIVGSVAWYAGNKSQDLLAWPVFIIFSVLSFFAFSKVSFDLEKNYGAEVSDKFITHLLLWSIPFYAAAANLFLNGIIDSKVIIISALGIISLGVIGFFKIKTDYKPEPNFWSVVLLIGFLISIIPIKLAVFFSKMPLEITGELNVNYFSEVANFLILFLFLLFVFLLIKIENFIKFNFSKLAFFSQIGLPLFFLTIYPSAILQPSGELVEYETDFLLKILIAFFVFYGMYDVAKRSIVSSKNKKWEEYFSPFAFFGLVIALSLKISQTSIPYIHSDDYHFGEHLLGWWSYLQGFVPYVDYIPAHGLIENDLRSIFSYIFYDGTAASTGEATRLVFVLLGFFAFMSVYYFKGSLLLAFLVTFLLLGVRLSWLFFVPFICFWLNSNLIKQPNKWLSVWIISAPIVILGVPPQGVLLVAAFGFLAFKILWDQIKLGDKESWRYIIFALISLLFVFATTPTFSMLFGAIRYVIENGSINQVSYGVPWSLSWNAEGKSGFLLEIIRMSWVLMPIFFLYLIYKNLSEFKSSRSFVYYLTVFLIFSMLLIPYSMGRIDPGGVSRPGLASIFAWAILFPLAMWGFSNNTIAKGFVLLTTVFMSALLGLGVTSFSGLPAIAAQKIYFDYQLKDFAMAGFPNIGRAYMEKNQWDRISRLKNILDLRLDADQTYLDLTSRNAHYFYLNRLPAMPVTAPYNLVSPSQQRRAVDALTASPPKLALFQADNITMDGGGLALRNPHLYRFVMDNYVPRMEAGFIVGYLKSEIKSATGVEITAEIKNITDENWLYGLGRRDSAVILSDPILASMLKAGDKIRLSNGEIRVVKKVWVEGSVIWLDGGLVTTTDISSGNIIDVIVSPSVYQEYAASLFHRAFAVSDFHKIPISWGRSEKSLQAKMTSPISLGALPLTTFHVSSHGSSYKIEGDDPFLIFDLSDLAITGRNSGLLKFDFNCIQKKSEPRLQIFWWGDERDGPFEASSVRFTAEDGALIVPLDASPWWTVLRKIKGLRFDIDNASTCQEFTIKNISLYQRR
jgi:hypothetical protein